MTEILDSLIPEVSRDLVFGTHENYRDNDPAGIGDEAILNEFNWSGPYKRRRKWLLMAGEMVSQVEQRRTRRSLKSHDDEKSTSELASFNRKPENINWQDCYNEAADAVAIYVGASTAEAIKDGLRRQTFGNEISIKVPREVLRQVVGRVNDDGDPAVGEVIAAHREAVESL